MKIATRTILAVTFAFVCIFAANVIAREARAADGKNFEFAEAKYTLAHHLPPGQYSSLYADEFASLVKEMTKGKVIIEVFGANQIGNLRENTDALRFGTLDFALTDLPTLATIMPKMSVMSLPYLFDDFAHVEKFYASGESDKLDQEIADTVGVKFLGHSHFGYRVVVGQKPINAPGDMHNVKISTPDKPVNVQTMTAFGANPTVVPYGETYTALQTSIVDACDLTADSVYLARLHEVCKAISCTNHIYVDGCIAVSNQLFQSLSPELQDVLIKAAEIATTNNRALAADEYEKALQNAVKETGIQRVNPDQEPFRQAVQPVWEQFYKDVPEGRALIDYIRSLK